MPRRKPLYTLTEEDAAIFEASRTDGRIFTSYYIREPSQESGWFFDDGIDPPWQLKVHHAPQTTICIVGGMSSGKTGAVAVSGLTWATMTPDFKFLCVAPTANQANQMWSFLVTTIRGTLFEQRFISREPTGGNTPQIHIDYKLPNGKKVSSIMEFLSAAEDAVRIKNYEGDMAVLDQAEMMDSLFDTLASLGTRVRGKVHGRFRKGQLILIANPEDHPELYQIYDQGEEFPETNLSITVSTYGNKNNTDAHIRDFERRLGNDPDKIRQHLAGERPLGQGIEFSGNLVRMALDENLDVIMEDAIRRGDSAFVCQKYDKADVAHWEMPPEKDRTYYIAGDPGTGHPPGKNSPVIRVWDVTNYPNAPAVLRAFWWGNGGGKYDAFLTQFKFYREYYRALLCAYDSTSGQKVLSETAFQDMHNVVAIDMGGSKKRSYITLLKLNMQSGRVRMPRGIKGQNYQYSKYRLPDDKIVQDIVACDLVFTGLLWREGFNEQIAADEKAPTGGDLAPAPEPDRYERDPIGDRYERAVDNTR